MSSNRRDASQRSIAGLVLATAVALTLAASGCGDDATVNPPGDTTESTTGDSEGIPGTTALDAWPTLPSGSNPATWTLSPDTVIDSSTTSFTALVTRLPCNDGATGAVLPPTVTIESGRIVVTFSVEPQSPGAHTCPGNDEVPFEVQLPEVVGDRTLFDGACLPDGAAVSTSFCAGGGARTPSD